MGSLYDSPVNEKTLFSALLFCVILVVSFPDFHGPFIRFVCENDMQLYFKLDSRQQKIHDQL